ncbi:PP2C family protein-serine/threonine phosphatase [Streptomyces sp. Tu 3180]|uniref:PP2C family protein-serine/threonine phosphatase n=1 Tax=Streptomyces sp. Tu 3180 TaxID=2682611 RepID=UPI001356B1BA|nr:PP2C family protein-serine/threonine phosphatase [Streptomyces sp. Tu 3180]KAF3463175.1 serine/threonine-protein phosphatase [Streptomyces sp. Tu 3180]
MDEGSGQQSMLAGLLAASHLLTFEQLPSCVAEHAVGSGFDEVQIYLADLQQTTLRLLTGHGPDAEQAPEGWPTQLAVEEAVPGRAFQSGQTLPADRTPQGGQPNEWWVPMRNGAERLGVLHITTSDRTLRTMEDMRSLADLVALLVVSKRSLSDSYPRLVRSRPMNVAAEMQWHLMPPLTFASDRVVLSAALEPAYQISGDTFDYAVADDVVHLGIFDAMGHDTAAGNTANLAVAACRNQRRQGASLAETSKAIERTLIEQFTGRYVTAVLADLDSHTGVLSWVNRGHHPPVLIPEEGGIIELHCDPGPPMGTDLGLEITMCTRQLHPGDRLVLYTDGITEARNPGGEEFGLRHFINFVTSHLNQGMPVPETLRRLVGSITDYHHEQLADDATVVLLHWHGPTPFDPGQAETLVGLEAPRTQRPL